MILTGHEIEKQIASGSIKIEPFDPALLNPNSYNYRIGTTIKYLHSDDTSNGSLTNWKEIEIPSDGYILLPHRLYLSTTYERIGSAQYVTSLIGRSSIGRLGLFLQISADLGNLGAAHSWTLELMTIQPLKIYSRMKIGQVSFWKPEGARHVYTGKYTDYNSPTPSLSTI